MAEEVMKSIETSEEMAIPLPLSHEEIMGMGEKAITLEENLDLMRSFFPEINIVPDVKDTKIPIISGITLYSYIRFLNAYPSTQAIDVYVNGKKVVSDLKYGCFSEYNKAFPGYYHIQAYKAGETEKPLMNTFINLVGYRIYTAAITGMKEMATLVLIYDSIRSLPKKTTFLRFVQLSPNAPVLDAHFNDTLVLTEVDFREVSRYLTATPSIYNLKARDYIKGDILAEHPNAQLEGGNAYTTYAIGDMKVEDGLQIIVEKEGISFLDF